MSNSSKSADQLIEQLKAQVESLQSELKKINNVSNVEENARVKQQKSQARFERIRDPEGPDSGVGYYLLDITVTATKATLYIPVSVASSKKSTGFVYQIEGTGESSIIKADISIQGEKNTQIKQGTISYCVIPAGKTVTFRIQNKIRGKIGRYYKIVINRINYKLNLNDTRYKQLNREISTNNLQFR